MGFYIVVAIFLVLVIVIFRNQSLFDKNLDRQMLEEDEEYFEIKYFKNMPLLYVLLSIFPSLAFFLKAFNQPIPLLLAGFFKESDSEAILGGWAKTGYLCVASGILFWALFNYVYKTRYKLVFDRDRVTLYSGKKMKITGTFDQIKIVNKPQGTSHSLAGCGPRIPYQIVFEHKKKRIEFDEDMDNSYKLVAIFKKRKYFDKKKEK